MILAAAGYKDLNGDGYVENRDGSKIDLQIVCPNGWSDWMTAIQVIAASAKQVGIKITPAYPEYGTLVDDRGHARYDLLLGNDRQVEQHAVDLLPVHLQPSDPGQPGDDELRAVRGPDSVESHEAARQDTVDGHQGLAAVMSKLQRTFLQNLPAIPLWYNGMWSMTNTSLLDELALVSRGAYTPTTWRNYWQLTGIDVLTHLKSTEHVRTEHVQ